jgi:hypothetical protein
MYEHLFLMKTIEKREVYVVKPLIILSIKFISCIIAFAIGLDLFFDATIVDILSFSLFITLVSYVVGERVVLPYLGNRAAAVTDFLLTYLSVWIFGSVLFESYIQIAWGSIIAATLVTAVEVVIHRFVDDRRINLEEDRRKPIFTQPLASFATEFAEEQDIKNIERNITKKKK